MFTFFSKGKPEGLKKMTTQLPGVRGDLNLMKKKDFCFKKNPCIFTIAAEENSVKH